MCLVPLFVQSLSDISGARIELYETNGAEGAARGAGIGAGYYRDTGEAFSKLRQMQTIEPARNEPLQKAYRNWKGELDRILSQ